MGKKVKKTSALQKRLDLRKLSKQLGIRYEGDALDDQIERKKSGGAYVNNQRREGGKRNG